MKTLGISREWKTELERRAPLCPDMVGELVEAGVRVIVEPSPVRIFSDQEYADQGATLSDDLSLCDLILGIKEPPLERLLPGRAQVFFSHTIKGQAYNMPLLARILELGGTLMDYELVTDGEGRRLVFFGYQAGQAGMINSLWTFGQRLRAQGIDTPFATLKQAKEYRDLDEAKSHIAEVADAYRADRSRILKAMGQETQVIAVAITGIGNVAQGALDVLQACRVKQMTPAELTAKDPKLIEDETGFVVALFDEPDLVEKCDGGAFDLGEYRSQPELYRGTFAQMIPCFDFLVTGHYWDSRYPRHLSLDQVEALYADQKVPRLRAIGDVSCDPKGGIECTLEATLPDRPCYVYNPNTRSINYGFEGPGMAMMAVDILPTEIAADSSRAFGRFLRPFLIELLEADYSRDTELLELPKPFMRAIIAHHGELMPRWQHLPV